MSFGFSLEVSVPVVVMPASRSAMSTFDGTVTRSASEAEIRPWIVVSVPEAVANGSAGALPATASTCVIVVGSVGR